MGLQCGICYEPYDEPVSIPCGHVFCSSCLAKTFEQHDGDLELPCPSCRTAFPTITLDPNMIPRKYRPHLTPCIRKLFLSTPDDPSDYQEHINSLESQLVELKEELPSLQAQVEQERRKKQEVEEELTAIKKERESLYRLVDVYKTREKELESRDRRQKFQVAGQIDELMNENKGLIQKLEEAQAKLGGLGLGKITPPSASRPLPLAQPSTPLRSAADAQPRPSIFSTPTTPRTLNFPNSSSLSFPTSSSLSPLKGGLAVAREDLQAKSRISSSTGSPGRFANLSLQASPSKFGSTPSKFGSYASRVDISKLSDTSSNSSSRFSFGEERTPLRGGLKIGEKRQREMDDVDMLAMDESSDGDEDQDRTLTPGGSKRPIRPLGVSGRSVRRKYGAQ